MEKEFVNSMEKETQAVKVAVHVRPLIANEKIQDCKECITIKAGEPQVSQFSPTSPTSIADYCFRRFRVMAIHRYLCILSYESKIFLLKKKKMKVFILHFLFNWMGRYKWVILGSHSIMFMEVRQPHHQWFSKNVFHPWWMECSMATMQLCLLMVRLASACFYPSNNLFSYK